MTDTPENNDQNPEAVETVTERPRKTLTLGGARPAEPETAPEAEIEAAKIVLGRLAGVVSAQGMGSRFRLFFKLLASRFRPSAPAKAGAIHAKIHVMISVR